MIYTPLVQSRLERRWLQRAAAFGLTVLASLSVQGALPVPLVDLSFAEGTGTTIANAGSLAGVASLVEVNGFPRFTNQVPSGVFTPKSNASALDFGGIAAGQGGQALDLLTSTDGTLGALNSFTICGWLNARDLNEGWGGNRIAFALASPDGPGFDLVQLGNGALRIGINQWPDGANNGGPASSAGVLKADPNLGNSNWVFLAVSYDPTLESGQLKYYTGKPQALASLDSTHNYKGGIDNGGVIESSGNLTLGNFSAVVGARNEMGPNGGSRVFRGLMDELRIYGQALSLAEVQQAQLNGALPPVPVTITQQPSAVKAFTGQTVTFRVQVTGSAPFTYQWQRAGADIAGATNESYTLPTAAIGDNGAVFQVKVSNAITSNILSDPALLTVVAESGHKISLSFADGGVVVTNLGNLGGNGIYVVKDGFPTASPNVPSGAFAPGNNIASVDFGAIESGQGGRAVDVTNAFDNTMGPMPAFTITGWLNCRDRREGWGGNRIAFALAEPGGAGFDLVQLADGSLRLGVNEWPDAGGGGGPRSTTDMVMEDASVGANNWVFFAVTYDSALPFGNVSYYFGKPDQAAQLDMALDYGKGVISRTGPLTIGNFSTVVGARTEAGPTGGSRCFRGLIDEIHVFNQALSLTDIQAQQIAPAYKPAVIESVAILQEPQSVTVFAGQGASFRVTVSGTPPVTCQWWKKHGTTETAITGATNQTYALSETTAADSGDQVWVVVANQKNTATSQKALLTVLPETNHKVALSFSEGSGLATANMGNLGGQGAFTQKDGMPVFTTQVPVGAFAPSGNAASVDFGAIADGQGGRAIDFTNAFDNTVGVLKGFTLAGWLNCQDLRAGWGGNRILFALASPGGPGFDLVQNADGALQLGVNQWPDGSPATSSAGKITEDSTVGAPNWIFFAVTYDGLNTFANVNYYFGSPTLAAALDVTADYDRGVINTSGPLTVGNFGATVSARNETGPNGGSRVFRGLMDELHVFSKVLTLEEIQALQKAPASSIITAPTLTVSRQTAEIVISWESAGNFQLQYQTQLGQGSWTDETISATTDGTRKTVRAPMTGSARFYRLIKR